jgi:hypothetical protein
MTREGGKRDERQDRQPATISVLPMNLRVGDRFTEGEFEWEVARGLSTSAAERACARACSGQGCPRASA